MSTLPAKIGELERGAFNLNRKRGRYSLVFCPFSIDGSLGQEERLCSRKLIHLTCIHECPARSLRPNPTVLLQSSLRLHQPLQYTFNCGLSGQGLLARLKPGQISPCRIWQLSYLSKQVFRLASPIYRSSYTKQAYI